MTRLREIAVALPAGEVTDAALARDHPDWDVDLVAELTGIRSRRVLADGETALDLSLRACAELLARPGLAGAEPDAILYCTQEPDHPAPGNAQLVHARLGLRDDVLALDFTHACSGFVYGLALADALVRAGTASRVLLVTAVGQSRRVNPRDRSLRVLLGDGAAATWVAGDGDGGGELVATRMCTHGRGFEHGYVPAGGARRPRSAETAREAVDASGNVRTAEDMHMNGTEVWAFVKSVVPGHVEAFLADNGLTVDDVDLFVFHQASKLILDSLTRALSLPPERVVVHLEEIGNLSSASIPVALRAALAQGAIGPGDRVLLCGFGVGISYGSAIVQF